MGSKSETGLYQDFSPDAGQLNRSSALPPLTPITSTWMHQVMNHPRILRSLIVQYGSPLNIHCAEPFYENHKEFKGIFEKLNIRNQVFFARKANKSAFLAELADKAGMGVDTASYRELRQCLDLGLDPSKLVVTAAVKSRKLMELAIEHEVLVILDNEDECELAQSLAEELKKYPRIGIRISGFDFKGGRMYSRFGMELRTVSGFLNDGFRPGQRFHRLAYEGLHFHLNGYDTDQRGAALHQCLDLVEELKKLDFQTLFIDVGGGFLVNYLKRKEEWDYFKSVLKKAVRCEENGITFQNDGLGYELIHGELHGHLNTYPYFNETPRAKFLERVLSFEDPFGIPTGKKVREAGVELRIEPGRSLLDQVGITVARVTYRKKDVDRNWMVGLEMNMTQLKSSSADFLLDPFVLYQTQDAESKAVEVFFTGAYCLEQDIILKRKIALPKLPEIDDLVVFVNTAGYMMHFYESEAHLFELARNLLYRPTGKEVTVANYSTDESV